MKKILVLIFLMIYCLSTFAEMKGDFALLNQKGSLKEGDLIEAVLKIWPIENFDQAEFTKLQGSIFFNSFQLMQILSIEPNSNNAEVIELKGNFLVRSEKIAPIFDLIYKSEHIALEAPRVKILPLEKKSKDYFVLDQTLEMNNGLYYALAILLTVLFILGYIKREKIRSILMNIKKDPKSSTIAYYSELFHRALTREDYEEIYSKKNIWLNLLNEKTAAHEQFLNVMNEHQYKKDWGDEEFQIVKKCFDNIRGSFK